MPSVPTTTSISPSRPASATAPRPPGPTAARGVRLVDGDANVVVVGELGDLLERRDVAVHREDRLGDDERRSRPGLLQAPLEVVHVVVAVDEDLSARQPAAVDDRGVVELVREDDLARARKRADDAQVREVPGAEQERGLSALERGELLLEPAVDGHRAGHEARRARAHAPAHRGVGGGLLHARVVGEAEVVVRAQQRDRPAVEDDVRALRTAHEARAPVQAETFELRQPGLDLGHRARAS